MRYKICALYCTFIMTFFLLQGDIVSANDISKEYIVKLNTEISMFNLESAPPEYYILTEDELRECLDADIVEWYEEDYEVFLLEGNEEITLEKEPTIDKWDLEMLDCGRAIELGCEGQTIRVGVIDSGVVQHPSLLNNICEGYSYTDDTTNVTDNLGHGTFVSGLICANADIGDVQGIAQDVKIVPLKCFDENYKTKVSVLSKAVRDAVDIYNCDIINMSLGLTSYSETLENAIEYALDNGVIVVAAVGNKGTDTLYYPAAFDRVIGVGSVNIDKNKSDFSQHNSSVDIVAPGEQVWSTDINGDFSQKSGTSFSTPLVVGNIAIMMNVDSNLTYDDIILNFQKTAIDLGEEGYDTSYGNGLLNVEKCIEEMLSTKELFISPIDLSENNTSVVILNNTTSNFVGCCMWGEYYKSCMKDMDWSNINLEPGQHIKIDTYIKQNNIRCFLWRSIEDISIIAEAREREAE